MEGFSAAARRAGRRSTWGIEVGECRVTTPKIESPYLTVAEAAAYLRISVRTLESSRQQKIGPAYHKHGGRVVYLKEDLDVWSRLVRFDYSGASVAEEARP